MTGDEIREKFRGILSPRISQELKIEWLALATDVFNLLKTVVEQTQKKS